MVAYTNDLRLAELATGEGSGTWGNTSNTNLELISEAFSFGTEAITTNADTHTTTIADGSTDPGRSLFLKYTGTLDSTCTITIGPNTVSKLWFIENATSGSQSIIIKQGSGATVTIANGQTKAIYSDGAGSGGAMVDAFQDLSIPDLFIDDDLTIGDDLTFTSDSAVITFGADGDTTLTHTDGSGLTLNSTNKIMFNDASQFIQGSSATVLALGATDEIDLTATLIDINGNADVSGTVTADGLTVDGTATIDGASGIPLTLDADAGANTNLQFSENGSLRWYLRSVTSSNDFNFFGNGASRLNIGSGGDISFYEDTGTTPKLFWDASAESLGIGTSTPFAKLSVTGASASANDSGIFQITDGTGANTDSKIVTGVVSSDYGWIQAVKPGTDVLDLALNPNGGNVGIGTSSPASYSANANNLVVYEAGNGGITIANGTSNEGALYFADGTSGSDVARGVVYYSHATNHMGFSTDSVERMRISADGVVTTPAQPSFQARLSANQTGFNSSGSFGLAVGFNVTDFNVGSHYSTSTGLFTAPVAGLYFFEAATYVNANALQSWFVKNGARASATDKMVRQVGTDARFLDNTAIMKLAANDTVGFHPFVVGNTSLTIINNINHTYFKGYLIG